MSRVTAGLVAAVGVALAGATTPAGASGGGGGSTLTQARQRLLVRSDFPSGWKAQGSATTSKGGGSSDFPGARQLAACLGVNPALIDLNAPSATSPTFQSNDGSDDVQDSVSVFSSAKVATQEYQSLANPRVPSCMTTVLQGPAGQQLLGSIGKGATVGTIAVSAVNSSWLVPHSSGFTISFPVTTQGMTLNSSITVVSMVRGRTGSQLTLTSVGLPFSAALARHLDVVAYART